MKTDELPLEIEPQRLVDAAASLSGEVAFKSMPRLLECLASHEGYAQFTLDFSKNESDVALISGELTADVTLECQRCMQPFLHELVLRILLSPVDELINANEIADDVEPLLMHEGKVKLAALIEDEILLALPYLPKHAPQDCPVEFEISTEPEVKKERPFKGLDKLIGKDATHC